MVYRPEPKLVLDQSLLRKEIETEKRERQKQKTMDTLLKKKDSKATKQIKTSKSNRSHLMIPS